MKGHLSDEEAERIYNAVIAIQDRQLKHEIKEALLQTCPSFREGCLNMAQNVGNQIAKLNQLLAPIAVIHAANDLAVRLDYMEKLQIRNLWKQKIQQIPDCGHFMIYEKSKEIASILDQFYSGEC